jgi:CheY-like chemotaxis protein
MMRCDMDLTGSAVAPGSIARGGVMNQRPKVLMIDDNKEICRLMKEYLEKTGRYEVTTFTDARMGVRYAQIEKPDVILLDLMMPDMDGTEAAEYLLEDETTRYIPIIFITAAIKRDEAEERLGQIHGHPILAKPVTPVEVMNEIEKILTLS